MDATGGDVELEITEGATPVTPGDLTEGDSSLELENAYGEIVLVSTTNDASIKLNGGAGTIVGTGATWFKNVTMNVINLGAGGGNQAITTDFGADLTAIDADSLIGYKQGGTVEVAPASAGPGVSGNYPGAWLVGDDAVLKAAGNKTVKINSTSGFTFTYPEA